ncbi:lysophospholipid acyltransferase family protein [Halocynthiibacter namhaensis]|uniref:lysophospholipid acyltransferase family protein n=1 Tax=Halocynthiibacter namhaensis TaxID=1290553 RepID=UPI0005794500|nr:lysophospholipid acyltransferase family protein [Halocynthiibacter namhaensis]
MFNKLYYAWRVVATTVSMVLFGVGGLCVTAFAFPAIALATRDRDERHRRAQHLIHGLFRVYILMLEALFLIKVSTKDKHKLNSCKGCLIIANHPSLLDVVVLMSLMPRAQCLVKSALWDNRFLGGAVRSAGYIRNDVSSEQLFEECSRQLKAGENIILFPEGTRTQPGTAIKFKRGAANIALASGADIQLVFITVTPSTLTKGQPWYHVARSRVKIDVESGERLDISTYLLHDTRSISARNLTRRLEQPYVK